MTGAAIAGYGLLLLPKPDRKESSPGFQAEEAYDRLLTDLEAENRELVDAVEKYKAEQDRTVERLSRRIREMEKQMSELAERPAAASGGSDSGLAGVPQAGPPAAPAVETSAQAEPPVTAAASADDAAIAAEPQSIRERYAELLNLDAKGRSVEQMAKALNMNKGEVQLILQLAKREAERLA